MENSEYNNTQKIWPTLWRTKFALTNRSSSGPLSSRSAEESAGHDTIEDVARSCHLAALSKKLDCLWARGSGSVESCRGVLETLGTKVEWFTRERARVEQQRDRKEARSYGRNAGVDGYQKRHLDRRLHSEELVGFAERV